MLVACVFNLSCSVSLLLLVVVLISILLGERLVYIYICFVVLAGARVSLLSLPVGALHFSMIPATCSCVAFRLSDEFLYFPGCCAPFIILRILILRIVGNFDGGVCTSLYVFLVKCPESFSFLAYIYICLGWHGACGETGRGASGGSAWTPKPNKHTKRQRNKD